MFFDATLKFAWLSLAAIVTQSTIDDAGTPDCFDALISARILHQVPTAIPECDDCIIMEWPWFIDLQVTRILEGDVEGRRLTVLAVQHTYYRRDLGARRWWLRRNSEGGFNILRLSGDARPRRCAADATPAMPYIRARPGRTLEDLRREGEERFGEH